MKKLVLGIFIGLVVLGLSGIATAGMLIPVNDKAKEKDRPDNSPVIETDEHWSLTSPGLEKIVFIHYKKGFAKPGTECGNEVCEPSENAKNCPADCGGVVEGGPTCYGFLSKGAKLKLVEDLTIHPDLNVSTILTSANEWDSHTSATLFGTSTTDSTANWDSDAPDGRNEFSFGNYPQSGVIAVTIVWGYFSGPPQKREIVEFDVMFDTDFIWGDAAINPAVMDLQNIATHEIGHGVGLDDVYENACSLVTMYGYSDYGETQKRTLEQPDITGIQKLYNGF